MPCARRRFTQAMIGAASRQNCVTMTTREADLRGGFELGGEQAVKLQIGDARVAVGVTRDADFRDAAARDQSGVDRLQRAAERAGGLGAVARDHQKLAHTRLASEPVEQMLQRVGGDEVAHRKVRHRLEARRAHARRLLHDLFLWPRRDGAEIDRRAGRRARPSAPRYPPASGRVASSDAPRMNDAISAAISAASERPARREHC